MTTINSTAVYRVHACAGTCIHTLYMYYASTHTVWIHTAISAKDILRMETNGVCQRRPSAIGIYTSDTLSMHMCTHSVRMHNYLYTKFVKMLNVTVEITQLLLWS